MRRTAVAIEKSRSNRGHSEELAPHNRITRGPISFEALSVIRELDEGPDMPWREMQERISRGDRIRGHAL